MNNLNCSSQVICFKKTFANLHKKEKKIFGFLVQMTQQTKIYL